MNCNRFEELFISENEKELLEHILQCSECREEYERMQKTEKVLKEAKPIFMQKKRQNRYIKITACIALMTVVSFTLLQNFSVDNNSNKVTKVAATTETVNQDTGVPVDEYGLVDLD